MAESPEGGRAAGSKSPEQQAAIRRRALPVAVCGSVCGIAGMVLGVGAGVTAYRPPSFLAMNLAFCAMLMGVGILVYAKGTPRTGWAAVFSVVAVILGMAGTGIYAKQAVNFRGLCETRELDNLSDIAGAARKYALAHGGVYPADVLVLLENNLIKPENLQSPYGGHDPMFDDFAAARKAAKSREELLQAVETHADYIYLGAGLKGVPEDLEGKILVAASANIVLHELVTVGYADGKSGFLTMADVGAARTANDEAREKLGLGAMELPASIQKALDAAAEQKKGG